MTHIGTAGNVDGTLCGMTANVDHSIHLDDSTIRAAATRLLAAAEVAGERRYLLGIAAIPAAGKSTLAGRLLDACEQLEPGAAVVVPMDGFHLTNAALDQRGLRKRKGSPETFDAAGYLGLLRHFSRREQTGWFPIYDRNLHEPALARTDRQKVDTTTRLVITEGNYLLLDEPPWRELSDVLDECWWLETNVETARQWLVSRHMRGGRSPEDALRHFERSDRLNVERVLTARRAPDRIVTWAPVT